MKLKEKSNSDQKRELSNEANRSDSGVNSKRLLMGEYPNVLKGQQYDLAAQTKDQSSYYIQEKQHKKLPVGKPHTIRYPRAVMIHIQHASLAG